jgi:hypothetical protein
MKGICFFIAALVSCISYVKANENKYVFVGQRGNETAFVLDIISDDMANNVTIEENGEVWIKVDKIVAIPKDQLVECANHDNSIKENKAATLFPYFLISHASSHALHENADEQEVRCPRCHFYYIPRPPTWGCPRCN